MATPFACPVCKTLLLPKADADRKRTYCPRCNTLIRFANLNTTPNVPLLPDVSSQLAGAPNRTPTERDHAAVEWPTRSVPSDSAETRRYRNAGKKVNPFILACVLSVAVLLGAVSMALLYEFSNRKSQPSPEPAVVAVTSRVLPPKPPDRPLIVPPGPGGIPKPEGPWKPFEKQPEEQAPKKDRPPEDPRPKRDNPPAKEPPRPEQPDPIERGQVLAKIKQLRDSKKPAERIAAAQALGKFGSKARMARRDLCRAMLTKQELNPQVRVAALDALKVIDPELGKLAASILLDQDKQASLKQADELEGDAEPLTPILLAVTEDLLDMPPPFFGMNLIILSLQILARVAPEGKDLAKLVNDKALAHPSPDIREAAIKLLSKLEHRQLASSKLMDLAKTELRLGVRLLAIQALIDVVNDRDRGRILETLKYIANSDSNPKVRDAASETLMQIAVK